jgi:hypothetical protein
MAQVDSATWFDYSGTLLSPCSKVTQGMDVLHKLEGLETTKSGIFIMPKERVTIHSTYWYLASKPLTLGMLGKFCIIILIKSGVAGITMMTGAVAVISACICSLQDSSV